MIMPPPEIVTELGTELAWSDELVSLVTRVAAVEVVREDESEAAYAELRRRLGPAYEAELQAVLAVLDLERGPEDFLDFPLPDIRRLTGPMLPKDLVVITAATGAGKTTFALNWLDFLARIECRTLFVGLEQDAEQLRTKWACHACRLDPDLVLTSQWDELPGDAIDRIHAHLLWQVSETTRRTVLFSAEPYVDRPTLGRLATDAAARGVRVVLVDHIHHMRHGTGQNGFAEFSASVQLAKDLAKQLGLVIVLMAQMKRGEGDARKRLYSAPQLSDIRGGGTIEETADAALAITREPKDGLTKEDWELFRDRKLSPADMVEPNTCRLWVLKHRRAGKRVGRTTKLRVIDGRLEQATDGLPVLPAGPTQLALERGDAWEPV